MQNNILIFNTIVDATARDRFDTTKPGFIFPQQPVTVIHLEDPLPNLMPFTHLLLTGSELSAAAGSQWDAKILQVIGHFLDAEKPMLGICHGHQMIARAIGGDGCCRRAAEPEFGWKRMTLEENELFAGVAQPVFLESRYDEVWQLPPSCKVLARNNTEAIQSFQLIGKPVWGVQFHPEMELEDGNVMIEEHLIQHPYERRFWANELKDVTLIRENHKIFENFAAACPA